MTGQQNMARQRVEKATADAKAAIGKAKAAVDKAKAARSKAQRAKARLDKASQVKIGALRVVSAYARETKSGKAAWNGVLEDKRAGVSYKVSAVAIS